MRRDTVVPEVMGIVEEMEGKGWRRAVEIAASLGMSRRQLERRWRLVYRLTGMRVRKKVLRKGIEGKGRRPYVYKLTLN